MASGVTLCGVVRCVQRNATAHCWPAAATSRARPFPTRYDSSTSPPPLWAARKRGAGRRTLNECAGGNVVPLDPGGRRGTSLRALRALRPLRALRALVAVQAPRKARQAQGLHPQATRGV